MLENNLIPQIHEGDQERSKHFHQDTAPHRCPGFPQQPLCRHMNLHGHFVNRLRYISIFTFWGFIKVHKSHLPAYLAEFTSRIYAADENVTADMLLQVQREIYFRQDVCKMMTGSHTEPNQLYGKKLDVFYYKTTTKPALLVAE